VTQINLRHPLIKKTLKALRSKSLYRKPAFWIGAGLFLLILMISFSGSDQPEAAVEQWAVVEKGGFSVEIVESGDVEAFSQRLVTTPMTSADQIQIIELVPEGKMVKAGEFLVQFDVSDLITTRDLAEQTLASAIADLNRMKAQQSLTISNMENTLKLTAYSNEQAKLRLEAQQYESEAKKEQAQLDLKQAEIDLKRVQEQLESQEVINQSQLLVMGTTIRKAQNNIRKIREQIGRLRITAPIDGMVVYQEVGSWDSRERLRNGYKARSGEALISIPDLAKMQVKLYLNEIDRAEISPGQSVKVILDAYPDTVFSGKVREVARLAQNIRGDSELKGFVVYADITGRGSQLKPGLSARIRVEINRLHDVFRVPVGTVFEVKGQPVVYPFRKTKPVKVSLGPRNDAYVAVQGNLKKGMKIAWNPPAEDARMLGYAEEKRRTDAANKTLMQSFAIFQKKGILYDYSKPPSDEPLMPQGGTPGGPDENMFFRQNEAGGSRGDFPQMFQMPQRAGGSENASGQTFNLRAGGRGTERPTTGGSENASGQTFNLRAAGRGTGGGQEAGGQMKRRGAAGRGSEATTTGGGQAAPQGRGSERAMRRGAARDSSMRRFRMQNGMPPDSVMRRFRNQGFRQRDVGIPTGGFRPGAGMPPDSVMRRFRNQGFPPGGGEFPDSTRRRFRTEGGQGVGGQARRRGAEGRGSGATTTEGRDGRGRDVGIPMEGFPPGDGAPPDSVIKKFQMEGSSPTPEMMQRFREMRKERRNEDSVSVRQEFQKIP
jgi:HlyD family secretion protein